MIVRPKQVYESFSVLAAIGGVIAIGLISGGGRDKKTTNDSLSQKVTSNPTVVLNGGHRPTPDVEAVASPAAADITLTRLAQNESGGNPLAHNKAEDARGILQIRKVMIDDVNRIIRVRRIVGLAEYTHDDAYNPVKAADMLYLFCWHYGFDTFEEIDSAWISGPDRNHIRK